MDLHASPTDTVGLSIPSPSYFGLVAPNYVVNSGFPLRSSQLPVAKLPAILDVPATLEYLETRGVPVVAVGTDEIPGFWSRESGVPAPASVPDVAAAARLVGTHADLGLGSGLLLCVPVPVADAYPLADARSAVETAIADADALGIEGPALTPWLLARIAEITAGGSVRANVALIVNNARFAGQLAAAVAGIS